MLPNFFTRHVPESRPFQHITRLLSSFSDIVRAFEHMTVTMLLLSHWLLLWHALHMTAFVIVLHAWQWAVICAYSLVLFIPASGFLLCDRFGSRRRPPCSPAMVGVATPHDAALRFGGPVKQDSTALWEGNEALGPPSSVPVAPDPSSDSDETAKLNTQCV